MTENTTKFPTLHSGLLWCVDGSAEGTHEIRITLRSTEEAKAWLTWLFDNCGKPDPTEIGKNNVSQNKTT